MSGNPRWSALALGLGAVILTQEAAKQSDVAGLESDSVSGFVLIKREKEKIYLSDAGAEFQEVFAGDEAEAGRFRQLLQAILPDGKAFRVPIGSTIVADGGAAGHWSAKPPDRWDK